MKQNNPRITCYACAREIVPRLWHFKHFGVTRVQHLCPFCGKVLYVTGPPPWLRLPFQITYAFFHVMHVFFKLVAAVLGAGNRFRGF